MNVMKLVEKKEYIHSHLHIAEEHIIDQFFQILQKEESLRNKLQSRAESAEKDIQSGKIYSRSEVEKRTNNIG